MAFGIFGVGSSGSNLPWILRKDGTFSGLLLLPLPWMLSQVPASQLLTCFRSTVSLQGFPDHTFKNHNLPQLTCHIHLWSYFSTAFITCLTHKYKIHLASFLSPPTRLWATYMRAGSCVLFTAVFFVSRATSGILSMLHVCYINMK